MSRDLLCIAPAPVRRMPLCSVFSQQHVAHVRIARMRQNARGSKNHGHGVSGGG